MFEWIDRYFLGFMFFLSGTVLAALAQIDFLHYVGLGVALIGLTIGYFDQSKKERR